LLRAVLDPIRRRLVPKRDANLASRSVRSGIWVAATTIGDRLLSLVSLFILARLLGPAEFGLIGVALLVLSALQSFSRLGLLDALVQRPEANVDRYFDTALVLTTARGVAMAAIMIVAAPYVSQLFGQPVTDIVRVLALAPLLGGLQSPAVAYFRKELEGHKRLVLIAGTALARDGVSIALALATGSVWALVAGQVAAAVARTVASYLLTDYRPTLSFDLQEARDLVGFGKWVTAYGVINYIVKEGDDIAVGILLDATALGLYRVTYRVGTLPVFEVTNVVADVMFPAYSKLQGDRGAVGRAFLRAFRATTALTLPAGVGVALVAPSFVAVALGPAWLDAVPLLQAIALYAAVVAVTRLFMPVWTAMGRPDLSVRTAVVRAVVLGLSIVPAIQAFGVLGAILAVAGSFAVAELPLRTYLLVSVTDVTLGRLAISVAYPSVACLGMAAAVLGVQSLLPGPPVVELSASVLTGAGVYAASAVVLSRLGWDIRASLRTLTGAVASDS
jgi:PST family polysaccharide transporter/lipopolysaccharide exporter